jgi:pimeloyl-ACP methyl ester carboxylesterase
MSLCAAAVMASDGELLLLLHAYPTASWGFHKLWGYWCDDYKLIAPDLPGSGFSDKPIGGDFSVARLADTVEALIVQSGAKIVHMLAHAYASIVVQELLARSLDEPNRPFSIGSACFINAGLFPNIGQPTRMQRLLLSPLGPWISRFTPHPYSIFRRRLAEAFGSDTQPSENEFRIIWRLLRFNRGLVVVSNMLVYLRDRERLADRLSGALERVARSVQSAMRIRASTATTPAPAGNTSRGLTSSSTSRSRCASAYPATAMTASTAASKSPLRPVR